MTDVNFMPSGPEAVPRVPQVAPKVAFPQELRPFEVPDYLKRDAPSAARPETETDYGKIDRKDAERRLESLKKIMDGLGHRLDFGLYEGTNEFFVKVIDRRNNRVVKMLPSEKLLELHAKLEKAMGLILDEEI